MARKGGNECYGIYYLASRRDKWRERCLVPHRITVQPEPQNADNDDCYHEEALAVTRKEDRPIKT